MKPGDLLPVFRTRVSPDHMRSLAVLLRDPNPIHLDREAVRKAGMGDRRINQGPANLAYVINMLQLAFPSCRIKRLKSRFLGVVHEGDEVEAHGRLEAIEGDDLLCLAWLDTGDRSRVIEVTAVLTPRENMN